MRERGEVDEADVEARHGVEPAGGRSGVRGGPGQEAVESGVWHLRSRAQSGEVLPRLGLSPCTALRLQKSFSVN